MSTFSFRPAKRQNVSLLVGLSAPSGGGKTWTAMLLAKGMSGGKKFCVIDTEAGRALHYADAYDFDHGDLTAPFTPSAYAEAIIAADKLGYPVIVVDSASHEWAGDGGILDMQEAELKRMGGGDNVKMASWIKPKGEHKRMMQKLLQVRAHIILCFRAEAKIDIVKEGNRTVVVPKKTLTSVDGWIPITEKAVPFELTCSFLLTPDAPGVPKPIKLQEQHRPFFPPGKPITEAAGVALAAWAAGGVSSEKPKLQPAAAVNGSSEHRGLCGKVLERNGPRGVVFWVAQVNGDEFSTTNAELAERVKQFAGIPVIVKFKPTAKGGRELLSIHDADDQHV